MLYYVYARVGELINVIYLDNVLGYLLQVLIKIVTMRL